jgi:hypothetical protein
MTYHPSHRGQLPTQERWPAATPAGGWPVAGPSPSGESGSGRHSASWEDDARWDGGASRVQSAPVEYAYQGYPRQAGYAHQGYSDQGYSDRGYGDRRYADRGYAGHDYAGEDYAAPGGYAGGTYADTAGYAEPRAYAEPGYAGPGYAEPGYAEPGYAEPVGYGRPVGYQEPSGYAGQAGYAEPVSQAGPAAYAEPGYPGQGYADPGYDGREEYRGDPDWGQGWDGYVYRDPGDDFEGVAGRQAPRPGREREPQRSWAELGAPDAGVVPERWQAEQERRREATRRGRLVGALTGLLALAVLVGVSSLAAVFAGAQASPAVVLGGMVAARVPLPLRDLGWAVLLAIVVAAAIWIGTLSRRSAAAGVAGLAGISLLAAFAVITRPQAHPADVLPTVAGGLAAIVDLLWLVRAAAPVALAASVASGFTPGRGGRRRAR